MLYFDGFNRRVVDAFVNAQFNMKLGRTQIGKGVKNIFPGSFIQCNLKIEISDDVDLFIYLILIPQSTELLYIITSLGAYKIITLTYYNAT